MLNSKPLGVEIRTSYVVLGLIFSPVLFGHQQIAQNMEKASVVRQARQQENDVRGELKSNVRKQREMSKLAIDRVSQGPCLPLVLKDGLQTPAYLEDGMEIVLPNGQPINSGIGCTELGSTAEIVNGKAFYVAHVAPQDRAEYLKYFQMQFNEGVEKDDNG
jgi:hypothetical protein